MTRIFIRKAEIADVVAITELFANTILTVNKADYSLEQVILWASGKEPLSNWLAKIQEQFFFVAEIENKIVGFSSLTETGYIDLMYVHEGYQRMGIAASLLITLEKTAQNLGINCLCSEVSITAKTFFDKNGFVLVSEQRKQYKGLIFINYKMEKILFLKE